ncbi:single-stranded DNA-binding protein [Luteimonas suaedae]|uniref:single-stranded DNA-binding protein n=1 Tax=Luteimonas suaedae TaxID=2605430 RepID=UPI0011ED6FAC|nr:single-stranded DNA-binding protein [Luteimonas suaedae]
MPIVTVKSSAVEERQITGGKIIRSQTAGLDLGNGFALPFRVGIGNRPAYQPGEYDIDPKSFGLTQYGDLMLNRFVDLVPIGAKPAPAGK